MSIQAYFTSSVNTDMPTLSTDAQNFAAEVNTPQKIFRKLAAVAERTGAAGVNTETLSADKTFVVGDAGILHRLDPDGTSRNLTPPSSGLVDGLQYWIYNAADGDGENLVFDSSGLNFTVRRGVMAAFTYDYDNTSWRELFTTDPDTFRIADAGALITATTVEDALQELAGVKQECTTRIGGLSASDDRYLMIAQTGGVTVNRIVLVCDTSTTGSDGSNNWTFQVVNLTQSNNLLSTAKTTNGSEITADAAYDLGVDQNQSLTADDVIELQVTKTGTPTDLSSAEILVVVEYVKA